MGLYGNIVVDPADDDYWPPVDREHVVTLDDVLVEDGRIAPFNVDGPTHVAMGRFGNVMLTAGDTDLDAVGHRRRGRALLLHQHRQHPPVQHRPPRRPDEADRRRQRPLRTRDVRRRGAAGTVGTGHRRRPSTSSPARSTSSTAHPATPTCSAPSPSTIRAPARRPVQPAAAEFESLRTAAELTAERARIEADRRRPPDKTLAFESLMPLLYGNPATAADAWTCPMHPDVLSDTPGTCPSAG